TLTPLFTTSVATSTSTPALSFTLSNAAAHQFFGNNTGSTAAPAFVQPAFTDLSGSVSAAQMPALTGDVTSTAGSTATTLAASIAGAHTFTGAVTLNAAGNSFTG